MSTSTTTARTASRHDPSQRRDLDIVAVRWRELPQRRDPTIPRPEHRVSPRHVLGFAIDLALHASAGAGAYLALPTLPGLHRIAATAAAFVLASILHRVLVQWIVRTTLGKALAGLVMIREDSGRRPTLWCTLRAWLISAGVIIGGLLDN